ncbi:hypothetical protein R1flu_014531 [Riccia fluitans]|uniref:Ribosomal protein S14 n=1 Tax=Riccia fluitans TaxID=41844 RepID=A0ABD1YH34_9MARC
MRETVNVAVAERVENRALTRMASRRRNIPGRAWQGIRGRSGQSRGVQQGTSRTLCPEYFRIGSLPIAYMLIQAEGNKPNSGTDVRRRDLTRAEGLFLYKMK